jgi:hypothetical protein
MASSAILLTPRAARLPVSVEMDFNVGGRSARVTVVNVTTYGFMAETVAEFSRGECGFLAIPDGERLQAEVKWSESGRFGAQFAPAIPTFTLARILSLYGA